MLKKKYYRTRSSFYRWKRLLFPSPAELRFISIMGGKVWQSKHVKWPGGFPLALVLSRGKFLKDEKFKREVRAGRYWIDLANDIYMGIDVDGKEYHKNVVAQFDRDSYLYMRGWRIHHIPAVRLWLEPSRVQQDVLKFLYK